MQIASFGSAPGVEALIYEAPPKGLYLKSLLDRVADWIAEDIGRKQLRPRLVHGHKLTMEGIVAARVAARLGIPYALSLQGNTDRRILAARPDLASLYRRIFHGASVVFPFSPWILAIAQARLGHRSGPVVVLPCATTADRIMAPRIVDPTVVSVFHLAHHRLKNAQALIAASTRIQRDVPNYRFEIIGNGSEAARRALDQAIHRAGAASVYLPGPVPHDKIQPRMNASAGMALVSHRESFGMVFIEAVLAGCPIVYPAGIAVDGFFDGCPFAIAAPSRDAEAIEDGIRRLLREQEQLKRSLARWQEGPGPKIFQRESIAAAYTHGLSLAVEEGAEGPLAGKRSAEGRGG